MQNHKSGMCAGVWSKKWRLPLIQVRVYEPIRSALADTHQIGQRDRRVVERESQRGAVKIAPGEDIAGLSENERIVGRRRRFDRKDIFAMGQSPANRAVD